MLQLSPYEIQRRLMTPEEKAQEEFDWQKGNLEFDWKLKSEAVVKKHNNYSIPFGEAEKKIAQ